MLHNLLDEHGVPREPRRRAGVSPRSVRQGAAELAGAAAQPVCEPGAITAPPGKAKEALSILFLSVEAFFPVSFKLGHSVSAAKACSLCLFVFFFF